MPDGNLKLSLAIGGLGFVTALRVARRAIQAVTDAADEQQRVLASVARRIEGLGDATELSTPSLARMASELQRVTTFGDEQILSLQSVLLTFRELGGVGEAEFRRVTETVLDMAAAIGIDALDNAIDDLFVLPAESTRKLQGAIEELVGTLEAPATKDAAASLGRLLADLATGAIEQFHILSAEILALLDPEDSNLRLRALALRRRNIADNPAAAGRTGSARVTADIDRRIRELLESRLGISRKGSTVILDLTAEVQPLSRATLDALRDSGGDFDRLLARLRADPAGLSRLHPGAADNGQDGAGSVARLPRRRPETPPLLARARELTAVVNLPAGFVDTDGATAVAASAIGEWFVRTAANWRKLAHAGGATTPLGVKRAFETGLVSGTTHMGIFAGQPSGANPGPIDDRAAIAAATWVENPAARQFVHNNSVIDYGVQASDVARPMWLGLFDSAKGGNLLWQDRLDVTPPDPNLGATLSIPMNAVGIGFAIDA